MSDGMGDLLLVLALHQATQSESLRVLRKRVMLLSIEAEWRKMVRTRHYLTSECLVDPSSSAWMKLYTHGDDLNYLNVTSLPRAGFEELLLRFKEHYHIPPPSARGGRPRRLRFHHQLLGLVLHYYVGSMELSTLCMVFGVPPATVCDTLYDAEVALSKALAAFPQARIAWPSPRKQRQLARLVAAREPLLQHAFGFIDGKNFRVQQPSNADLQNAMYNGWLHAVYVTGTICFAADGCIIWSRHNCPGSWNDSETSTGFRVKLADPSLCPDRRLGVVSDSAFPCSGDMVGRILTPLKDGDLDRLRPAVRSTARTLHNAVTSVRQAAEWGMGSVEKVYSRLRLPLPYDPVQRGMRLNNLFRLVNLRVRLTEISQIRTTFSGSHSMDVTV